MLNLRNPSLRLDPVPDATKDQKLSWEKELLGLYITEHPLKEFSEQLRNRTIECSSLGQCSTSGKIKIAGVVNEVKKIITRSGEPMLFVKIEDMSGSTELLVFPKILKEMGDIWQTGKIVLAGGRVSDKDGEMKLICDEVREITRGNIDEVAKRLCVVPTQFYTQKENENGSDPAAEEKNDKKGTIFIRLASFEQEKVQKLKSVFFEHKGECKVFLLVKALDGYKKIETDYSIAINEDCNKAIEGIVGMNAIKVC